MSIILFNNVHAVRVLKYYCITINQATIIIINLQYSITINHAHFR